MTISDLCIRDKDIPLSVADAILECHIRPMEKIHQRLKIKASERSGYRSLDYELSKDRSGTSQHTFEDTWLNGAGAVDWGLVEWSQIDFKRLTALILDGTDYQRICVYRSFIHCDFKQGSRYNGQKELYQSDDLSNWEFVKYV